MPTRPVHPRACGELILFWIFASAFSGSSPRLRGTLFFTRRLGGNTRFIPAPAGNSIAAVSQPDNRPVHPRACGELTTCPSPTRSATGSSPRLRGTRDLPPAGPGVLRFIPAPAGNSSAWPLLRSVSTVHPRACGELQSLGQRAGTMSGSSPRLRGTRSIARFAAIIRRFIPAPAGNSSSLLPGTIPRTVHPRACGELDPSMVGNRGGNGSSPRLRGTRTPSHIRPFCCRFIPAPAGNSDD